MLLFTTVNKRSWFIEVVDQLTAPVKLAVFRPSQNQEKFESALPQLSREQFYAIYRMVLNIRCLTVQQIAKSIEISSGCGCIILIEILRINKLLAR